ncbi:MATE family efflux transporter [Thermosyntropha sp.]|uniref:MATE family efflux transporter n=1 Tax=Thermosyntropha sp. TaxID=2740820 RepID=UPI0025ECF3A9|nr:MATE family efflux transporter [Thermosyntropha sp.]MBO8159589.1 MATE family efflux transporter [Thermosyntropha sp.]
MHDNMQMLEKSSIGRTLISLSIPGTIAMLVNAMYNIVDTVFIGQGVGTLGIAAVAIYLPIQLLVFAFAQMIGIGAASYMSRSMGAKNLEKMNYIAGNSFLYSGILGIIFVTVGITFTEPVLRFFGASSTIMPFAVDYARIMFIGTLYYPLCTSSNSLMRGEGNALDAMICMIIGFAVNIILDYVFIFPLSMGVKGAALATVIAKFCSLLYLIYYLNSKKTIIKISPEYLRFDREIFWETITVGFASFVIGGTRSLSCIVSNHVLGFYGGDLAVAVYGVIYKVIMFLGMPVSGITQGMRPLIGYNYGAKQYRRVIKTIKLGLFYSSLLAGIGTLLVELFPAFIMSLFSKDAELIKNGTAALRLTLLMIPFIGIQMIGTTIFQALGRAKTAVTIALLRQGLIFVPLILLIPVFMNDKLLGIWLSFPLSDLISILIIAPVIKREIDILYHLEAKKTKQGVLGR